MREPVTPVGQDIGHYNTKTIIGLTADKQLVVPAVVIRADRIKSVSIANKTDYRDDTGSYLVGASAIEAGGEVSDTDSKRLSSTEYRIQCLHSLRALGVTHADIVAGLPLHLFKEKNLRMAQQRLIASFTAPGLRIKRVKLVPEPYGAYFDMIYDDKGDIANHAYAEGRIGIIDIGGNTIDVLIMLPGGRFGDGKAVTQGILHAYKKIEDHLTEKYPGTNWQRLNMAEVLRDGKVTAYGKEVSVAAIAKQAKNDLIAAVTREANGLWGSGADLQAVLLTGGAVEAIAPELQKKFPHAVVAEKPVLANARGFWKFRVANPESNV